MSRGIAEILGFSELSVHTEVVKFKTFPQPFPNTLNYASAANIDKVMKFYNLGDKTFETDFKCRGSKIELRFCSFLGCVHLVPPARIKKNK